MNLNPKHLERSVAIGYSNSTSTGSNNQIDDAEDKFLAFAGPSPTSTDADGPRGRKSVFFGASGLQGGFQGFGASRTLLQAQDFSV